MYPRLIGIVGLAGSGKSTLAGVLERDHGYVRQRFAKPLKDMTAIFLRAAGVPESEIDARIDGDLKLADIPGLGCTSRHVMQTIGTEWGRNCIRGDLWLHLARTGVEAAWARGERVVIDDVRFRNEAAAIQDMGGMLIRITRPGIVAGTHVSELEQAEIAEDWPVWNEGTVADLGGSLRMAFAHARDVGKVAA